MEEGGVKGDGWKKEGLRGMGGRRRGKGDGWKEGFEGGWVEKEGVKRDGWKKET